MGARRMKANAMIFAQKLNDMKNLAPPKKFVPRLVQHATITVVVMAIMERKKMKAAKMEKRKEMKGVKMKEMKAAKKKKRKEMKVAKKKRKEMKEKKKKKKKKNKVKMKMKRTKYE